MKMKSDEMWVRNSYLRVCVCVPKQSHVCVFLNNRMCLPELPVSNFDFILVVIYHVAVVCPLFIMTPGVGRSVLDILRRLFPNSVLQMCMCVCTDKYTLYARTHTLNLHIHTPNAYTHTHTLTLYTHTNSFESHTLSLYAL